MKTSVFVGYKNHRIANPDWRRIKTAYYTYLSFKSLVRQRYDSLLFLKYGKFKYKVNIINKKYLDKAFKNGPHFLAEKHGLTAVPFCIDRKGKNMNFRLFKPINHKGKNKEKVAQETADIIEKMILMNLKRWQLFDKVLQN